MADAENSGRGFGAAPAAKQKLRKKARTPAAQPVAGSAGAGSPSAAEERGRLALEQMRLESGAQPANPFKKKGPALTPEEEAPIDPSAGVMPEVVSQRMLKRVVPFAALPVFGGVLAFVGFWYANTQLQLDLPPTIVAYTTQAMLLLSFAGITYGVMSTSWDEEIEGSLLGVENIVRNVNLMRGTEVERQAEAKLANEAEEAAEAGIVMSSEALRKRNERND